MTPVRTDTSALPAPAILDTLRTIETPEGVELALRIAGPLPRAIAWFIDITVKGTVLLVSSMFLPLLGNFGIGIQLVMLFLLAWFYPVLFEVYSHGATPGKRVMRLSVVYRDGTPVGWSGAMIRNLVRAVDMLPFCYGIGLVAMLCNRNFQRLGDLAADTVVVHRQTDPTGQADSTDSTRPLGVPLRPEDQYAILLFSERARWLSAERSIELADILAGQITSGGQRGVDELKAHASWAAGRQ